MASTDEDTPTAEEHFGRRIRAERQARLWTQAELAERLKDHGVDLHPTAIAKLEQTDPGRQRAIRLNEAVALAAALEVPLEHLLYSKEGLVEATLQDAKNTVETLLDGTSNLIDRIDSLRLAKTEAGHPDTHNHALALMTVHTLGIMKLASVIEYVLRGSATYESYEATAAEAIHWLTDPQDDDEDSDEEQEDGNHD